MIERQRNKPKESFDTLWDTTIPQLGGVTDSQIRLQFYGHYDFTMKIGDGEYKRYYTSDLNPNIVHDVILDVGVNTNLTLKIKGYCPLYATVTEPQTKLKDVLQWGELNLNGKNTFINCPNLKNISATDIPFKPTSFDRLFENSGIQTVNRLNEWNVSKVTTARRCFYNCSNFNQNINDWDVSAIKDFSSFLYECSIFNQPLNKWNVSNAKYLEMMFYSCRNFNQDVTMWNVGKGENLSQMFKFAHKLNRDFSKWNVGNAKNLGQMFRSTLCNHDLSGWDVSNCIDLDGFFYESKSNYPLDKWNTRKLETMELMLWDNGSFDQDLSVLDISSLKNIRRIFSKAGTRVFSDINYGKFLKKIDEEGIPELHRFSGSDSMALECKMKCPSQYVVNRTNLINRGWTIDDGGLL